MLPDPYRGLAEADGAFVGTLTATDRGIPVDNTGTLIDYAFDVEAAIKGEIGDTIVVKSAADGAACGFEMPIGDRVLGGFEDGAFGEAFEDVAFVHEVDLAGRDVVGAGDYIDLAVAPQAGEDLASLQQLLDRE